MRPLTWSPLDGVSETETPREATFRKPKRQGDGVPTVPVPGRPVRGSSSGRPIMAALDLLGRRWTLRILWELQAEPLGARELGRRCDEMSSSVLYQRLDELTAAGL